MQEQDSMQELFIYESQQLIESLEEILLQGENEHRLNDEQINEIFRAMHTIKGSASMMGYEALARLTHALEDLFDQIRENKPRSADWDNIFDIVLTGVDAIKTEIAGIVSGNASSLDSTDLINKIHKYLDLISNRKPGANAADAPLPERDDFAEYTANAAYYKIKIAFEPECGMENMRAFGVINSLTPHCIGVAHIPADLMLPAASEEIIANGLVVYIHSAENPDDIKKLLDSTMFLQAVSLAPIHEESAELPESLLPKKTAATQAKDGGDASSAENVAKQNFISVNVNKLDKLMDLVGEIVTTESMVTRNPEIAKLQIEGFEKSSQQLKKLINELQDTVMSIRMLPVSTTFHKMRRIVRDVAKKVNKDVTLRLIGEETEVDKNIIDTLSDPLMHLIRNSVDHGLESPADRAKSGKPITGTVTLEARNTGGDVIIIVSDDGQGLDRDKIIKKAIEKGFTTKSENEISDKEAYSFIFLPGFSTNTEVTEFSGRGVGMDVVRRNIEKVGGTISVESEPGRGTTTNIRIPLTLAIIEGMKLRVGHLMFIVPLLSIQESFKPNMKDVFLDPNGKEMIMIRDVCYPIIRLHELFNIKSEVSELSEGILIMIHTDTNSYCIFVDQLVGEQQAVIKPLPGYIQKHNTGLHGIGGCAILGDGSISLIIDINNLVI